jgi:hypothetical protein
MKRFLFLIIIGALLLSACNGGVNKTDPVLPVTGITTTAAPITQPDEPTETPEPPVALTDGITVITFSDQNGKAVGQQPDQGHQHPQL